MAWEEFLSPLSGKTWIQRGQVNGIVYLGEEEFP